MCEDRGEMLPLQPHSVTLVINHRCVDTNSSERALRSMQACRKRCMMQCLKAPNLSHKIFLTCISLISCHNHSLFFGIVSIIGYCMRADGGGKSSCSSLVLILQCPQTSKLHYLWPDTCAARWNKSHLKSIKQNSQFAHSQAPSLLQNTELGESSAEPKCSADGQFTSHTKVAIDSTAFRHCCS